MIDERRRRGSGMLINLPGLGSSAAGVSLGVSFFQPPGMERGFWIGMMNGLMR